MSTDISLPTIRHDGWTPDRKTIFCETLAETGLVVEACAAVGKSTNTAYAQRRRDPIFAAAWEAALGVARDRLADTLLARSIEGTIEQYYRDGELVGEKRVLDSRLGLAILRRLDRLAEQGRATSTRGMRSLDEPCPIDFDLALEALKGEDEQLASHILDCLYGIPIPETHETHEPPISLEDEAAWPTETGWRTRFPPPDGFTGTEQGHWGDHDYERDCTEEEEALLIAAERADREAARTAEATRRDAWFAALARHTTPSPVIPDLIRDPSGGETPKQGGKRAPVAAALATSNQQPQS